MKIRLYDRKDLGDRLWDISDLDMPPFAKRTDLIVTFETEGILNKEDLHALMIQGKNPEYVVTLRNRLSYENWSGPEYVTRNLELKQNGFKPILDTYSRIVGEKWVELGTLPSHGSRPSPIKHLSFEKAILNAYQSQFPCIEEIIIPCPSGWFESQLSQTNYSGYLDLKKYPGKEDHNFFEALRVCKVDTKPHWEF